jgi:hypothetical protein
MKQGQHVYADVHRCSFLDLRSWSPPHALAMSGKRMGVRGVAVPLLTGGVLGTRPVRVRAS